MCSRETEIIEKMERNLMKCNCVYEDYEEEEGGLMYLFIDGWMSSVFGPHLKFGQQVLFVFVCGFDLFSISHGANISLVGVCDDAMRESNHLSFLSVVSNNNNGSPSVIESMNGWYPKN